MTFQTQFEHDDSKNGTTVGNHGDFVISFHFVHARVIIPVYCINSKLREGKHHG